MSGYRVFSKLLMGRQISRNGPRIIIRVVEVKFSDLGEEQKPAMGSLNPQSHMVSANHCFVLYPLIHLANFHHDVKNPRPLLYGRILSRESAEGS